MTLTLFKDLIQLVIVFSLGFGLCYYFNVLQNVEQAKENLPEACLPLYNYCVALENAERERTCNE